jgi:hypothetical protein
MATGNKKLVIIAGCGAAQAVRRCIEAVAIIRLQVTYSRRWLLLSMTGCCAKISGEEVNSLIE